MVLPFCLDDLEIESHASPAAFEDAAGGPALRPVEALLDDLEDAFPSLLPLKVVSMRPFFSGLGVLDTTLGGTGSFGGGYGLSYDPKEIWGLLWDRSVIGRCESLFCKVVVRKGKGGGVGCDKFGYFT